MGSSGKATTFATPGSSAVGDSAAAGSATSFPRSDHVHGREAFAAALAPAVSGGAAGSAATPARSDHQHAAVAFNYGDLGFLGGNGDPATCPGGTLLSASAAAGTLAFARIRIPVACTVTNLLVYLTAAGSGLTANQCLAALFTSGGTWVKTSVNQATNWAGSASLQTMALTSTYAAAAGDYYIGLFYNGTTAPTFARYSVTSAGLSNAGLSAPNLRFGSTSDTGLTTAMPGSLGTQTAQAAAFFAAVS